MFHSLTKLSGGVHQAAPLHVGDTGPSLPCCAGLARSGAQPSLSPGTSGRPPLTVLFPDPCLLLAPQGQPRAEGRSIQTACRHPPTSAAAPSRTPTARSTSPPTGACPTSTRHGALTARAMQEGKQGPWRGTGASSRDTKKEHTDQSQEPPRAAEIEAAPAEAHTAPCRRVLWSLRGRKSPDTHPIPSATGGPASG